MIKNLKKQLEAIRNNAAAQGGLNDTDTAMLQALLVEMHPAGNDNMPFTDEQLKKLSIMEKTGTGSKYIH